MPELFTPVDYDPFGPDAQVVPARSPRPYIEITPRPRDTDPNQPLGVSTGQPGKVVPRPTPEIPIAPELTISPEVQRAFQSMTPVIPFQQRVSEEVAKPVAKTFADILYSQDPLGALDQTFKGMLDLGILGPPAGKAAATGAAAASHFLPAIFAGPGARTADRAALKIAQEMASRGESKEAIWHATGWFQGTEGKWRFEIPDYPSRLYADKPGMPGPRLVEHELEHPELFEAYPHLKTGVVKPYEAENPFGGPSRVRGAYNDLTGDILLNPELPLGERKSVLLHELQHGVQHEEGFSPGASKYSPEVIREVERQRAQIERQAQQEIDIISKARDDYVRDKLGAQVGDWVTHYRVVKEFWANNPELRARLNDAHQRLSMGDRPPERLRFEAYKRVAGETEARNVQRRMFDPPDQLREPGNEPWRSQDIPTERQIIREPEELQRRLPGLSMDEGGGLPPIDLSGMFYHGTARENPTFAPGRVAYFTPDKAEAAKHAEMDAQIAGGIQNVIRAKLGVKNPAVLDRIEMQDLHLNPKRVEELRAAGYDSAVSHDSANEIVIFDPKNIHTTPVEHDPFKEPHPATISTRYPTTKRPTEDYINNILLGDLDAMRRDPGLWAHNVNLVRGYPNLSAAERKGPVAEVEQRFINHVRDNLLALYDRMPPEWRERAMQWYEGANHIALDRARQYGVPDYVAAAVYAALSPQRDWFQNVSLGDRVMYIWNNYRSMPIASDKDMLKHMMPKIEQLFPGLTKEEYQILRTQSLDQIADRDMKGMWLRGFDQTYHDPAYNIVTPEGMFGELQRNLPKGERGEGDLTRIQWGTNAHIGNAILALESGGDLAKISPLMGMKHKVRNFYNNILDPFSPLGFSTIDTHAVAAGLGRPLSGKNIEVAHSLDMWPGKGLPAAKGSDVSGIRGTYPLYGEGYRLAAQERGILPRQMQSVTWEGIRGLFPEEFKGPMNVGGRHTKAIDDIWREARKEGLSTQEIWEKLYAYARAHGGDRKPDWAR